ncbi:nuclear transport factor 2 family protein [Flavobacterium capsici]|uniref:Nuclear transport factor 2 family protein n=1 Tax=Flavobacterium capsici TaxID=3075618 RepID=A0AA96F0S5_9FLAO|nr:MULTISPECIES: nuclear transport factor 2 family protein [unclassified Flavobacterium]WNM20381.1 nuclear transport factor 2 family protein [Flavobacterium sp. PMR2A8]WNM21771.1 nuclear transport factor 2 family protein [Flavobacterium sp. PMTSA4]
MKLNIKPNCANAPKKELVKQLTIAFASYDIPKAMNFMDSNISWTLVGEAPIIGKAQFAEALEKMSDNKAKTLTIESILTHGKEAAVHGEMLMEDGTVFGFSDFYEFNSSKSEMVKTIVSYVVLKEKKTD